MRRDRSHTRERQCGSGAVMTAAASEPSYGRDALKRVAAEERLNLSRMAWSSGSAPGRRRPSPSRRSLSGIGKDCVSLEFPPLNAWRPRRGSGHSALLIRRAWAHRPYDRRCRRSGTRHAQSDQGTGRCIAAREDRCRREPAPRNHCRWDQAGKSVRYPYRFLWRPSPSG